MYNVLYMYFNDVPLENVDSTYVPFAWIKSNGTNMTTPVTTSFRNTRCIVELTKLFPCPQANILTWPVETGLAKVGMIAQILKSIMSSRE
jgi:hypothetical protein